MITISQLAEKIGANLLGDGSGFVKAVGPIESACETDITFISDAKRESFLKNTKAAGVIAAKQVDGFSRPQLLVKDVNIALVEALKIFAPRLNLPEPGIDNTAKVSDSAEIDKTASIGAFVLIADGVCIGKNCVIAAGCKIGQNTVIGDNCRLDNNVVVYHNCKIGNNVIIQANTVIGSTGFGYTQVKNGHQLIPHNGGVIIEDFVEIGTNSCVDRAKFGNTIIGAGTKIDNLVHIAHNVIIGKCCLIIAQVGIAGSSKIGDGVVLAGQVGVVDNVSIGSGTLIGAQAGVMHDIPAGKKAVGSPAIDYTEELKLVVLRAKLPKMVQQLKDLTRRIESLETAKDDKKSG
ncbi:MAG: UDP-3-O-(3-hydroxymyristoyl)glucosamine N-acyltransferase [Phycisphaerae bacterium]